MSRDASEQRRIARIALEAAGPEAGFALAGSGAIREHGFIDRPTEDVDLFTIQSAQHEFASALERVVAALREAGYDLQIREQRPCFSRLVLSRGSAEPVVTADLGVVAWDRWPGGPCAHAQCLLHGGGGFGNIGLGVVVSLAHALGGRYPVAHGRVNALLLHVSRSARP